MPAMWRQAFHRAPGPESAGEPEFLPGNDGFSYGFAQCEVEDHFGTAVMWNKPVILLAVWNPSGS
jgi:hypothetical protein